MKQWAEQNLSAPQMALNYLTHFKKLNWKARTCQDTKDGIANFISRASYSVNQATGLANMLTDMVTGTQEGEVGNLRRDVGSATDTAEQARAPGGSKWQRGRPCC